MPEQSRVSRVEYSLHRRQLRPEIAVRGGTAPDTAIAESQEEAIP